MTNIDSMLGNMRISFVGYSFEKFNSERKEKNRPITKGKCYFQEYAKEER